MGDILNQYFSSVFTVEKDIKTWRKEKNGKIRDPWIMREVMDVVTKRKEAYEDMGDSEISAKHTHMLVDFEIKKQMVLGLLKGIKVDMSPRPDATGEVLEDLQVANDVHLFKKGNRDNPGNYSLEMTKVCNEGSAADIVYMDFSEAFHKIPH
eukprot:g32610.t1